METIIWFTLMIKKNILVCVLLFWCWSWGLCVVQTGAPSRCLARRASVWRLAGRREGRASSRRTESCCHWLLRRYKCRQMEFTGSEQAETPGEESRRAGLDAPRPATSRRFTHTHPPRIGLIFKNDSNQWRRDARVRSYLWNPAWIPVRVWSVR